MCLLAAAALHLGFQATVTAVVYPALLEAGRRGDDRAVDWAVVHRAHSRRIAPVVVVVYGALLPPVLVAAWRSADDLQPAQVLAVLGAALALATTALVAAPAHRSLGRGWQESVGRRLLGADRVRLVGAAVCLAGAAASFL